MYLIEIQLPVYDRQGQRFSASLYQTTRNDLADRYGGVTAHSSGDVAASAHDGTPSLDANGAPVRDGSVVYEVIADRLDRAWWKEYRSVLQQRFDDGEPLKILSHQVTLPQ